MLYASAKGPMGTMNAIPNENQFSESSEVAQARKNKMERLKFLEQQKRKSRNDTAGMVFNSTMDTGAMSVRPHSLFRRKQLDEDDNGSEKQAHASGDEKDDRATDCNLRTDDGSNHDLADSPTSSIRNLRLHRSGSLEMSATEKELLNRGISAVYDPTENSDEEEEAARVEQQSPQAVAKEDTSSTRNEHTDVSQQWVENTAILKPLLKDKWKFCMAPAPKGITVKCRIKRAKTEGKHPTYQLFVELSDNGKKQFILQAKKRTKSKTSNYLITISQNGENKDDVVAKLRSNFLGSEYILFDNGVSPRNGIVGTHTRHELCSMSYETNPFGLKGPRKMVIVIPAMTENDEMVEFVPKNADVRLLPEKKHSANEKGDGVMLLSNKSPVWKEETQSFVLNFNGRVTLPSVKNFQIVNRDDTDNIILQFGRVGEDSFTLDYKYPMSAAQAFGIALSSFDGKIACE